MCALGEIQWYITKLQDTRPVLLGRQCYLEDYGAFTFILKLKEMVKE